MDGIAFLLGSICDLGLGGVRLAYLPACPAALHYLRKVGGYRKASKANEQIFKQAVDEVANTTERSSKT